MTIMTRAAGALLGIAAVGVTACGGGGGGGGGSAATGISSATKVSNIAAEVPSAIASKGTLTIAEDAEYAPNEFIASDGHTVVGMDADLAAALGQVMGLRVNVVNVLFDNILPGLTSGKYDLGISSFTDTKDREKAYDFVTYFSAGTSFYVKASGGPAITSLDQLCGHHVTAQKGTTQQDDATAQNKKCTDAGKPAIDLLLYEKQIDVNLALQSGRAEVGLADSPVAAYQVQQLHGQFKLSGQPYGTAPYGIAIPKGNGMAQPILDAIKELMSDGIYGAIMTKWGIQSGEINNPQINGAQS